MDIPGFDIRFSELDDAAYLSSWLTYPDACDDFPFNFEEMPDAVRNWIGYSRFKACLTGTIDNEPCAVGALFLMPYKKVSHHASFYLIVDPNHRRKGIGTSMVRNLLHLAKNRFKLESVHAEMYLPSQLESILDRLKFEFVAKQEDFTKLPNGKFHSRLIVEHFFHE